MNVNHLAYLWVLMLGILGSGAHHNRETIMFQQQLPNSGILMVVQEPLIPRSTLIGLLSADTTRLVAGASCIKIIIRSPADEFHQLWSEMYILERKEEYDEFQVLDILLLPDRLVMTLVMPSSMIAMIEVGFHDSDRFILLPPADWSLLGASIPAPSGRLGAKLNHNDEKKQVEVQVTDFLQDTKQYTIFAQKGGEWAFERVKQWQETVPTQ